MATGQVVLTRPRTPMHIQKSRPAVPAFLQKLFQMVNDPNNHELIRWSDAGDSFFVLDHERFAREVLGCWFKHQNFASFVRQLNMYGFHKIPHLQQGVLRSDTETNFWNFGHPNFRRGQPELLSLIQRKKQAAQVGEEQIIDLRESPETSAQSATAATGQLVDFQALMNGIAAIQRHQSNITAELNELKRSNELLWQEAMDARQRHQKQRDTIDRIVKFLAGVFGSRLNSHKESGINSIPSRAVIPRRAMRLLIEGGGLKKAVVEDEQDLMEKRSETSSGFDLYPIIETPFTVPSPAPSETLSAASAYPGALDPFDGTVKPPTLTTTAPEAPSRTDASTTEATSLSSASPTTAEQPTTPDRATLSNQEPDPGLQMLFSQMTPSQLSQLLSSLSHALEPFPSDSHDLPLPPTSSQITQYTPPLSEIFNQSVPMENLLSLDESDYSNRLSKSWKTIDDIQADVDSSNAEIDNFIRSFGIDPNKDMSTSDLDVSGFSSVPPITMSNDLPSLDINTALPMDTSMQGTDSGCSSPLSPAPLFDLLLNGNATSCSSLTDVNEGIHPLIQSQVQSSALKQTRPPIAVPPGSDLSPSTKRKSELGNEGSPLAESETVMPSSSPTTARGSNKRRKK